MVPARYSAVRIVWCAAVWRSGNVLVLPVLFDPPSSGGFRQVLACSLLTLSSRIFPLV